MPAVRIPRYQQQVATPSISTPTVRGVAVADDPTGAAMASLGQTIGVIGEQIQKARREADLSDRLGKATAELSELELTYENDPDFRTSPQRFRKDAEAIRAKYLDGVDDQVVKQAFSSQYGKLSQAKSINVRKGAFVKERDYNVASLDTNIETYAQASAQAKTPVEREFIANQARLAIASMQQGGWINNVDAGKRERQFLSRSEEAVILRDMQIDPSMTADRLALDPKYAANIDPVQRERWVDQSYRRAESERVRMEREDEKYRKRRGDELLKDAFSKMERGQLTRADVEQARAFVEPSEYKSLLKGLHGGDERRDDPHAYADLQKLIYTNPAEAERLAFVYHQNGRIKNGTLSATLDRARSIGRSEGPKSEYERSRAFITMALAPNQLDNNDPAPRARMALALREYDDFAAKGDKTGKELKDKADEVVKRRAVVDMVEMARNTSMGGDINNPSVVLQGVQVQAAKAREDLAARRINEKDYEACLVRLNSVRNKAQWCEEILAKKH